MTKFNIGDIGIFNEYSSNDWLNYENAQCEVVEIDGANSGLCLKFKDDFTLEVDYKEFTKLLNKEIHN